MPNELGFLLPGWNAATAPPRETLRGAYCRLRPLEISDAPVLWREIRDFPELWLYMNDGPFGNEAEFKLWLEDNLARDDRFFTAICDADGAIIGFCAYLRVDLVNGSIEIGNVLFSPRLQRTRAATEAMFLLMRAVFDNGFRRYEWKCNALNEPSKRAAKRLGFSYEGQFRQAAVVKGRNRDTDWFSITDGEWPARKLAFEKWLAPANFDESGGQIRKLEELRAA